MWNRGGLDRTRPQQRNLTTNRRQGSRIFQAVAIELQQETARPESVLVPMVELIKFVLARLSQEHVISDTGRESARSVSPC